MNKHPFLWSWHSRGEGSLNPLPSGGTSELSRGWGWLSKAFAQRRLNSVKKNAAKTLKMVHRVSLWHTSSASVELRGPSEWEGRKACLQKEHMGVRAKGQVDPVSNWLLRMYNSHRFFPILFPKLHHFALPLLSPSSFYISLNKNCIEQWHLPVVLY